jgi:hypothetical protein
MASEFKRRRAAALLEIYRASKAIDREVRSMWVSIKERLPERGKYVLTLQDNEKIEIRYIGPCSGVCCAHGFVVINNVTHWMPLPAPPGALDEVMAALDIVQRNHHRGHFCAVSNCPICGKQTSDTRASCHECEAKAIDKAKGALQRLKGE